MSDISIQQGNEPTQWRDAKRYIWLLTPLSGLLPIFCIYMYMSHGENLFWTVAFLGWLYVIVPVLDWLFGEDGNNPPEEAVAALSNDTYYRVVVWAAMPIFYVVYIMGMWFVMTQNLPFWAQVAFVVSIGFANGAANNIGHELGHKQSKVDQFIATLTLTAIGNGHFCAEHNRNHHVKVSTPEDCSSAKMGETLYAFALRDMPGAVRGAWALEKMRLAKKQHSVLSVHNKLLQSWGASVAIAVGLALWLGWGVIPFIIVYSFIATSTLTLANYVEHYGLLRQKLDNGRYEPCQPRHSWNTNHIVSNVMQIHLQRHSDHHANPMRPYQALRNFDDLPTLPSGYPGCFALAMVPSLWFKVMDPKVMAWAGGDLEKVNATEKRRAEYRA